MNESRFEMPCVGEGGWEIFRGWLKGDPVYVEEGEIASGAWTGGCIV